VDTLSFMFSEKELKVLKLIGKRRLTIKRLTRSYYKKDAIPTNGSNNIAATVRRIVIKAHMYNLKWTIKGEGGGRGGRTVWKASK